MTVESRWRLDGARAVVTGGTRGIGLATVVELLDLGASVVTAGRDLDDLDPRAGYAVAVAGDDEALERAVPRRLDRRGHRRRGLPGAEDDRAAAGPRGQVPGDDAFGKRCRDGGVMILAFRRDARVEHRPDLERLEHVCGAADVIALRMGQDERDQALHAEALELSGDVSLGRALVDENRTFRNLEQDRVSLADVEHRDPEPVRERRGLAGNGMTPRRMTS